MTTKELVQWVLNAQDAIEGSWDDETHSYALTQEQAIDATTPPNTGNISSTNPTKAEHDMALTMICNNWNECQVWIKDL
jgi:hypothetical protein